MPAMTWSPPRYLEAYDIRTREIRYVWDEADLRWVYTVAKDVDLKAVPWRNWVDAAICGLTIATVEWVVFRLSPFDPDPTPGYAIEAAWCANIDRRYCESLEFSRREWTGPVRGPMLTCMNIMHEALFESPEAGTKPLHCPAIAAQLVGHICADSQSPFAEWRQRVTERLNQFYQAPNPILDLYGETESRMVVPPQIFDPDLPFDPSQAPPLADAFLRSADFRSNPRLVAPEQLRREGFEGTPYRYL